MGHHTFLISWRGTTLEDCVDLTELGNMHVFELLQNDTSYLQKELRPLVSKHLYWDRNPVNAVYLVNLDENVTADDVNKWFQEDFSASVNVISNNGTKVL